LRRVRMAGWCWQSCWRCWWSACSLFAVSSIWWCPAEGGNQQAEKQRIHDGAGNIELLGGCFLRVVRQVLAELLALLVVGLFFIRRQLNMVVPLLPVDLLRMW
jgi:hypothetical protein